MSFFFFFFLCARTKKTCCRVQSLPLSGAIQKIRAAPLFLINYLLCNIYISNYLPFHYIYIWVWYSTCSRERGEVHPSPEYLCVVYICAKQRSYIHTYIATYIRQPLYLFFPFLSPFLPFSPSLSFFPYKPVIHKVIFSERTPYICT